MPTVLPHPYATRNPRGFMKQPLACSLCVCLADRLEVGPVCAGALLLPLCGLSLPNVITRADNVSALGSLGPHVCVFKATKTALRTSTEIGVAAETRLLICAILSDRFRSDRLQKWNKSACGISRHTPANYCMSRRHRGTSHCRPESGSVHGQ